MFKKLLIALGLLLCVSSGAFAQTYSIWSGQTPSGTVAQTNQYQLGQEFYATNTDGGYVIGVLFYKHSSETGTHAVSVFDTNGNLLASATSTNETASGWQTVMLSTPVVITQNTHYVAVRHYNGSATYYEDSKTYSVTNAPLVTNQRRWIASTSGTAYPNSSGTTVTNWVDVIYVQKSAAKACFPMP